MIKRITRWLRGKWFDWQHRNVPRDYCCCGDSMINHEEPYNCGHSPVDAYEYYRDSYVNDR